MDIGIILATALVCLFLFSLSTRLGYSRPEIKEAPIIVRTQVLNACGRPGLGRAVADMVGELAVGRMRFDVVDIGNFERTDVRRSFVINHHLSDEQTRSIVNALKIGPLDITEAEPAYNDLGFDLTIVLGSNTTEVSPVVPAEHP
ncbi:MAG: LytR C-terminal domain-containing protein [candidate division Zixibacteria bacterium]|nr:LytR C-terminal domain-containing protein [candidate division Zixibacteria bacterium]